MQTKASLYLLDFAISFCMDFDIRSHLFISVPVWRAVSHNSIVNLMATLLPHAFFETTLCTEVTIKERSVVDK